MKNREVIKLPKRVTIYPGIDKEGNKEQFDYIDLEIGNMYAIVGNTGSGKTRLIKDIEQMAQGESPTKRLIGIDGNLPGNNERYSMTNSLIAHLSQNMKFVLDVSVGDFIALHAACRKKSIDTGRVLELANNITSEQIEFESNLNLLSGGQTRALMIADIAYVCDSPIVLIDEIENAGIDKEVAFDALLDSQKLILVVTHDPHTALLSAKRIVMSNGAVTCIQTRTEGEKCLEQKLREVYKETLTYQNALRNGEQLM